mgnify:CR=1 FL=1
MPPLTSIFHDQFFVERYDLPSDQEVHVEKLNSDREQLDDFLHHEGDLQDSLLLQKLKGTTYHEL